MQHGIGHVPSPGATTDFGNRAGMGAWLQAMANKMPMTAAQVATASLKALFASRAELMFGGLNKVWSGLTSMAPKALVEKTAAIYEKYL